MYQFSGRVAQVMLFWRRDASSGDAWIILSVIGDGIALARAAVPAKHHEGEEQLPRGVAVFQGKTAG